MPSNVVVVIALGILIFAIRAWIWWKEGRVKKWPVVEGLVEAVVPIDTTRMEIRYSFAVEGRQFQGVMKSKVLPGQLERMNQFSGHVARVRYKPGDPTENQLLGMTAPSAFRSVRQ